MADQKVIITSTNTNGQTLQKTLTNINPEAGNTELKTFAQMFTAMTYNTYGKTDRVIKYNCDTEGGGAVVSKQTATITLAAASVSKADFESALQNGYGYNLNFSYDGDATPFAVISSTQCGVSAKRGSDSNTHFQVYAGRDSSGAYPSLSYPFTVTIRADETDNYKAAEPKVFTVTA